MAKQINHISVFLASPSDLSEERIAVRQVIDELNGIVRHTMGLHLDLLTWEADAYPSAGIDAQDVINSQIGSDYDIFIGMMWQRFGSPTGRAGSGTEEEFERAYNRYVQTEGHTKVMIYFSAKPIQPDNIDLEQMVKVRQFKSKIEAKGLLHWSFNDVESFQKILKIHLLKQVSDVNNGLVNGIEKKNSSDTLSQVIDNTVSSDDDIDEEGFFDLMEVFSENFAEVEKTLNKMAGHIEDLGEQMSRKASKIDALNKAPGQATNNYRVLLDSVAADIINYVNLTTVELPRFHDLFTIGIDAFSNSLTKAETTGGGMSTDELEGLIEAIAGAKGNIEFATSAIVGFRQTTSNVPPVAKSVNRATRLLRNSLDSVISEFTNSMSLLDELRSTIESILYRRTDGDSSAEEV